MRRLTFLLRGYEEGRWTARLNNYDTTRYDEVIAEMQARFDRLAGVPERGK